MRPKIIFFDYGGTLAYMDPPIERIWLHLLEELECQADPEALGYALQEANEIAGRLNIYDYCGRMGEYWRQYDGVVLKRLGIADPEETFADAIHVGFERRDWYHLYSGAREVLDALRSRGHRLGIISNNVDQLVTRLEQFELAPYFDTVTYSQEARADKPDPAIFRLALDRVGCTPKEAVHVGDSYEADVAGARSVGITPVLVDRDRHYAHVDCLCVADLRQVPEVVSAMADASAHPRTLEGG